MTGLKSELDKVTTEELAHYAVGENERDAAVAVVRKFSKHQAASQLLRHYYLSLPEAREEMAADIRVVAQKQGNFLFALQTTAHRYFYLCSSAQALYLGEIEKGIDDSAILGYFGYGSVGEFDARMPEDYDDLPTLAASEDGTIAPTCVACGVGIGETHILGCPIEQCPWCEAQLNRCPCRFEKLGVDRIEDETLLDRFEELLEERGRIAFDPGQNPSYPIAGSDPAPGDTMDDQ